jgi:CIC family chloride channel protein
LNSTAHSKANSNTPEYRKKVQRTLYISGLALVNAVIVGFIAKGLVLLINFFTNVSFYGRMSFEEVSPAQNNLGFWVIAVPVAGGLVVGLMARFGSPAIRGHGIPEAMEKIVKGESRIHPLITILKPLSAAISIGTGGPFGAEGPIISTGGALGSFCGQTLHITTQERKILLAAGATAGMTAIFGTPFAAILLAIELLLFEFSSRSFIPVMIACIGGACMHFFLFGTGATFPMPPVHAASTESIIAYAVIGLIIGLASVVVTKAIYLVEDLFEHLPVHWMWWPALGGVAVGVVGIFAPDTLGVGYPNITHALSGKLPLAILISLCFWKFVSWSIALGSGTSGGTLAPLLTIGSALGCLLGMLAQQYFPDAGIMLPLAALVGMAALFAGAARALLTSIVFAMETTMQESTLLPLIAGCVTSYLVSFIFMRTTIMTEKIHRRGITLPDSYYPDLLEGQSIQDIMVATNIFPTITGTQRIDAIKLWLQGRGLNYPYNTLLVVDDTNTLVGALPKDRLFDHSIDASQSIASLIPHKPYSLYHDNSLQLAIEFILKTGQDILPVVDRNSRQFKGVISSKDILKVFEQRLKDETHKEKHISIRANTRKVLSRAGIYSNADR